MDLWLPIRGVAAEYTGDPINAAFDTARKVTCLKARDNGARNYHR